MSENAGEQAGEPDQPPGEESGTYRGEGVGRREQVDSGPATGRGIRTRRPCGRAEAPRATRATAATMSAPPTAMWSGTGARRQAPELSGRDRDEVAATPERPGPAARSGLSRQGPLQRTRSREWPRTWATEIPAMRDTRARSRRAGLVRGVSPKVMPARAGSRRGRRRRGRRGRACRSGWRCRATA